MILRLKVEGFKNLLDAEVHFGAFTCVTGANGVGKSNLFDAIQFLSGLAQQKSLVEAALSIRGGGSPQGTGYRHIFSHYGSGFGDEILFLADLLVPQTATDEYGQRAQASSTFLRYKLRIRNRGEHPSGPIEIVEEDLRTLRSGDFRECAPFDYSETWKKSVYQGKFKRTPLISTEDGKVKLHQDQKTGGKALPFKASDLPRTVLSRTIASESPTGFCARKEMENWTFLQLEPNALRRPSAFNAPRQMGSNGDNLPAVIARLGEERFQEIANSLSDLNQEVRGLRVDRNEARQQYELYVKSGSTEYAAHSLSDGTLRFLSLAVLDLDPQFTGVLCMEEPENGIHPERVSAMVELLPGIAVDSREPVDLTNPLRQVIINTHSPTLVSLVPEDSLVAAEPGRSLVSHTHVQTVQFSGLDGTWRQRLGNRGVSKGVVLSYLNPVENTERDREEETDGERVTGRKRVKDAAIEQLDPRSGVAVMRGAG